jgi:hypothetical protein
MLKEPVEKRKQGIMEGGNWRGLAGAGRLYFKKRYNVGISPVQT